MAIQAPNLVAASNLIAAELACTMVAMIRPWLIALGLRERVMLDHAEDFGGDRASRR